MLCSEQQIAFFSAWKHVTTMFLINFENLSSISNIFQELHEFSALTDPAIICVYFRTTNRHFRDQGNVPHPTSKLLKCDLNPSLRIFAAGKACLVFLFYNCIFFLGS